MATLGGQTLGSIGSFKYKELQALAKSCGVRANLSKDKLIEHLLKESHTRRGDPETLEQPDKRTRVANKESGIVSASRKIPKQPEFEKRRPTTGDSSNRFNLAHQNIFNAQPSIERYCRTPKRTGTKATTPAERTAVFTAGASRDETKLVAKAPPETPTFPVKALVGSSMKAVKKGVTVASRPCTLVVQPSNKKPTQVKEFRLSSTNGKREGFTFKPYTGPVRQVTPAPVALGDKTTFFNMGRSSKKARNNARQSVKAIGIKDKLASGKAQAARRAAHAQSGKVRRGEKIGQGRDGRQSAWG